MQRVRVPISVFPKLREPQRGHWRVLCVVCSHDCLLLVGAQAGYRAAGGTFLEKGNEVIHEGEFTLRPLSPAEVERGEQVDELFAKGKATIGQKERAKIYHELQQIIARDVPMILLYYPAEIAVANKRLKEVVPSPWRVYHNMEDWYVE